MLKATFKIKGDNIIEKISLSLIESHRAEFMVNYKFPTGSVFMFDQHGKYGSSINFTLNVIVDHSKIDSDKNELLIQCFAQGEKDGLYIKFKNYEKASIKDLHSYLLDYSETNNLNWLLDKIEYV